MNTLVATMSDGSVCIKIGLSGNQTPRVHQLMFFDGSESNSFGLIKDTALDLHRKTVIDASMLTIDDVCIDLEFRDDENDVIMVESDGDFRSFCYMLSLSTKRGKVFATVKPLKETTHTTSASVTTQTEANNEGTKSSRNQDDKMIIDAVADIFSIAAVSMKAGITAAMMEKDLVANVATNATPKTTKDVVTKSQMNSLNSLKAAKKLTKESFKMINRAMKQNIADNGNVEVPANKKEKKIPVEECKVLVEGKEVLGKCIDVVTAPTTSNVTEVHRSNTCDVSNVSQVHRRHTCDMCRQYPIIGVRFHATNLPDFDLCEICHNAFQPSGIVLNEIVLPMENNSKTITIDGKVTEQSISTVQSIHRNHTCDKCLISPIIGKRYRAANLPDFDLCEKCHHDNFQIFFEKVLPVIAVNCDPPTNVNENLSNTMDMNTSKVEKQDDGVSKKKDTSVNTTTAVQFIHGRHTCDQCLTTPIIGKRFHATNLPDFDLCETCHGNYKGTDVLFEEALLERDVPFQERWNRKRGAHEGNLKRRMLHRHLRSRGYRACNRPSERSSVQEGEKVESSTVTPCPITSMPAVEAKSSISDDLALEEAIRRSLLDVVISNDDSEKASTIPATPTLETVSDSKTDCVSIQADTKKIYNEAKIVGQFESASNQTDMKIDSEAEIVGQFESASEAFITSVKESFASEAVGSGEVAEFVGETLDRMSEAIEDLNRDLMDKGDVIFVEDDLSVNGSYDDFSGPKIVDGEDDDVSRGSWSVVEEKDHSVADDSCLGRAAEAIGSALFQSDMMRSMDGSSAAISSVTSVPTEAPSIISTEQGITHVQRQRWASQLAQLHELGFQDDALCINTLESLSAANIGVDSDEEVTVEQVIEKMMDK